MAAVLLTSLKAIVAGMKTLGVARVVKYAGRTSGDTYGPGVDWDAKRDPTTIGDVDGKQRQIAVWHLYAIAGQTTLPSRLGKVTDGSDVWHVLEAQRSFGDLKFDCTCFLQV